MKKIVVVGGGFTGAATAIHLACEAQTPINISVVEPRDEVGRGVAYSATDCDHRLNAPAAIHILLPNDPLAFENWLKRTGRYETDPEMEEFDGALFPARSDLGAFVSEQFAAHCSDNASGSSIDHVKARAVRLERTHKGINIYLDDGTCLLSDLAVITTGIEKPAVPSSISTEVTAHERFIADPWQLEQIDNIKSDARVLILGAGLTAADVMATILREKPNASITAISRSGLKPASRPDKALPLSQSIWERIRTSPSLFELRHGHLESVREILGALRRAIREDAAEGLPWQIAFDELRDSVRRVWGSLPESEKLRFQRHLRRRYDSCRFRYPPQTLKILETAENHNRLMFKTAHLDRAILNEQGFEITWSDVKPGVAHTATFDNIVNCIGPSDLSNQSNTTFLKTVVKDRHARISTLGIGIDVNDKCQVISADGRLQTDLYAFGPLTFAKFGSPLGVPFIVDQVTSVVPMMLNGNPSIKS